MALREEYRSAFERWKITAAVWEAERKKIEADRKFDRAQREAALTKLGQAPAEPIRPIMVAPDPTIEGLAKFWHALPGSIGLFSAEGGQMTGGHGFGPDYKLKTAAALSVLWDGGGVRRVRAGDGITDLPGRRLALHLLIQPDAGAAFLSDPTLRDQGLLSRILIASPQSLAGSRLWKEPPPSLDAALKRYAAVMCELLQRAAPSANSQGNELTPTPLGFSYPANAAWRVFHDEIERQMASGGAFEHLRDVAGKAAENVARLAGVLTIVEHLTRWRSALRPWRRPVSSCCGTCKRR